MLQDVEAAQLLVDRVRRPWRRDDADVVQRGQKVAERRAKLMTALRHRRGTRAAGDVLVEEVRDVTRREITHRASALGEPSAEVHHAADVGVTGVIGVPSVDEVLQVRGDTCGQGVCLRGRGRRHAPQGKAGLHRVS